MANISEVDRLLMESDSSDLDEDLGTATIEHLIGAQSKDAKPAASKIPTTASSARTSANLAAPRQQPSSSAAAKLTFS